MFRSDEKEEGLATEGFVPATQWDALRRQYGAEPSQTRGLRSLTSALQTENPELLSSGPREIALALPMANWGSQESGPPLDDFTVGEIMNSSQRGESRRRDVDQCFASRAFLDDLEWAVQTYEIRLGYLESAPVDGVDLELGVLEAVQDLSRIVARTTPRRAAARSDEATGNPG